MHLIIYIYYLKLNFIINIHFKLLFYSLHKLELLNLLN